jgi:hypothetical protein
MVQEFAESFARPCLANPSPIEDNSHEGKLASEARRGDGTSNEP